MTLTGDTPKLRHLLADWYSLGETERTIVCRIAGRLRLGQEHYGQLELASDRRDWRGEAVEEALDLVVYLMIERITRGDAKGDADAL